MYKYRMSWRTSKGEKIENQIFTADIITHQLKNLEEWKATDIKIELIKED